MKKASKAFQRGKKTKSDAPIVASADFMGGEVYTDMNHDGIFKAKAGDSK